MNVKSKINNY